MIVVRKQQYSTRKYEGTLRGDRGSRIRATAAPSDRSREGRQICLQPLDGAPQPVALNIDERLDIGGRRQTLQSVQSSLNVLLAPREPAHRLGLHRLQ